jgi:hypothetical protein
VSNVRAAKTEAKCKPVTAGRKLDVIRIVDSYPNVTPTKIAKMKHTEKRSPSAAYYSAFPRNKYVIVMISVVFLMHLIINMYCEYFYFGLKLIWYTFVNPAF